MKENIKGRMRERQREREEKKREREKKIRRKGLEKGKGICSLCTRTLCSRSAAGSARRRRR
jgi:hypothetical protein